MNTIPRARTVSVLAESLGASISQVQYILRTRPHIRPLGKAGAAYIYPERAEAQIRYELNRIEARRCSRATS